MIIHSIIDPNEIFATDIKSDYCYKNINGAFIEGVKSDDGVMINRVISTNPSDYLNKDYKLGSKLK